MKFQLTIFSLATSLLTLTFAQDISQIPACATSAAISSLAKTGCSPSDFGCICKNQAFINSLLPVIQKACSPADVAKTIQVAQALCLQSGVTITIPSGTATGSAPAATASGSASSAVVASGSATGSATGVSTTAAAAGTTASGSTGSVASATSAAASAATSASGAGKGVEAAGVMGALSLFGAVVAFL